MIVSRTLPYIYGITLSALFAGSSLASEVCLHSPEEAATNFVTWSIEDAERTTELIQPRNLNKYRSRLQQIFDDRYSPDSASLRKHLLGPEWSQEQTSSATDKELVGRFLASGKPRRKGWRVANVRAIESRQGQFGDYEVTVTYVIETPTGDSTQKRDFSAHKAGNCWQVQVPIETWIRLDQLSKTLKESREIPDTPRQGPSRVSLQVAAASQTPRVGMKQLPRRGEGTPVWVDSTALLTEGEVIGAYAAWDCEASALDPEDAAVRLTFSPEGAKALRTWTEVNKGAMLAVVIDARVVVFARVAGVLGSGLSVCLPGEKLEQAQILAEDLMGIPR